MKLQATEITEIIKRQIAHHETMVEIAEVGTVIQAGDGIARIYGLENAMAGELLEFPHHVMGMVLNLEEDNVGAVIFGEYERIAEGDTVKRTGRIASVPSTHRPPDATARSFSWQRLARRGYKARQDLPF